MNSMDYQMNIIMTDFKSEFSKNWYKLEDFLDNGIDGCSEDVKLDIKLIVIDKMHWFLEELKEYKTWAKENPEEARKDANTGFNMDPF